MLLKILVSINSLFSMHQHLFRLPWWLSGKESVLPVQETWVQSLRPEDPLEEEMAIPSSILAWETPWTEEPGGFYSAGGAKESDTTE